MRKSDCPIHYALEIFGDRWSLLIIRDMMLKGKRTFSEFTDSEEGIATNILANRLILLESNGLIAKIGKLQNKRQSIYQLTEKGWDLLPTILEIVLWSAKYDNQTGAPASFVKRAKSDRSQLMHIIRTTAETVQHD